ncbi:hypothetical protein Shyhy02_50970 [Streptomyces hygroscopicus subsp. hygroscopicus]|nr:hypothetical protein Shyhy02_50970 [Streptomyces hygroscopicus subsp. hygroscopicus]
MVSRLRRVSATPARDAPAGARRRAQEGVRTSLARWPLTDLTQMLRLLSLTVPPGLALPLSRVLPEVADNFTDRELTCVIRSFPNPNRWLLTLMLLGADTVTVQRPS